MADFLRRAGEADILVNNLGIFEPAPFEAITDADWYRYFDTNVMSGIRLSRHYVPKMRERGWGRIVFISSESALNIPTEMIHYGVTKTAQLAVSRGLAETLAGTGVTVNSVLPGPTGRRVSRSYSTSSPSSRACPIRRRRRSSSPEPPGLVLLRLATVEEVAEMVAYACTPQASATTGAALGSTGGWCARLRNASAPRCRGSDECRRAAPAGRAALQRLWFQG